MLVAQLRRLALDVGSRAGARAASRAPGGARAARSSRGRGARRAAARRCPGHRSRNAPSPRRPPRRPARRPPSSARAAPRSLQALVSRSPSTAAPKYTSCFLEHRPPLLLRRVLSWCFDRSGLRRASDARCGRSRRPRPPRHVLVPEGAGRPPRRAAACAATTTRGRARRRARRGGRGELQVADCAAHGQRVSSACSSRSKKPDQLSRRVSVACNARSLLKANPRAAAHFGPVLTSRPLAHRRESGRPP